MKRTKPSRITSAKAPIARKVTSELIAMRAEWMVEYIRKTMHGFQFFRHIKMVERAHSFTTDMHGYVREARLHDKAIKSHSYSGDDQIFRLCASGQNVEIGIRFEGVSKIAMRNFINGSICEGLYAWEMHDFLHIYNSSSQRVPDLSVFHFLENIEGRENCGCRIAEKYKGEVFVYLDCNIYGGDAAIICNDIHCIVYELN
jgi:hypothetical protein